MIATHAPIFSGRENGLTGRKTPQLREPNNKIQLLTIDRSDGAEEPINRNSQIHIVERKIAQLAVLSESTNPPEAVRTTLQENNVNW